MDFAVGVLVQNASKPGRAGMIRRWLLAKDENAKVTEKLSVAQGACHSLVE